MKHKKQAHHKKAATQTGVQHPLRLSEEDRKRTLEVVLKCDSAGSQEALISSLLTVQIPQVELEIIHKDIGSITKSDLHIASTGSRRVIGFNVGIMPQIKDLSREQGIEVRIYEVIYKLVNDIKEIARSMIPLEVEEIITGAAKVIALFKSSRRGIILGCDVMRGTLALGKKFRVISAMGPVYTGKIESLHIEKDAVKEARVGQQVGLKISDFKNAEIGDLVECFDNVRSGIKKPWQPKGGVFRF